MKYIINALREDREIEDLIALAIYIVFLLAPGAMYIIGESIESVGLCIGSLFVGCFDIMMTFSE